jgi:hypothetical protein
MGRSGKSPENRYRFADHARYLDEWFATLNLSRDVTLVLHDSALFQLGAPTFERRAWDRLYGGDRTAGAVGGLSQRSRCDVSSVSLGRGEHLILDDNAFIEV